MDEVTDVDRQVAQAKADGPILVRASFAFRRPKAHARANGELRAAAPRHHTQKPDIDNLLKAVLDACTQIGLWRDDDQVVRADTSKHWAGGDARPGLQLDIDTLE